MSDITREPSEYLVLRNGKFFYTKGTEVKSPKSRGMSERLLETFCWLTGHIPFRQLKDNGPYMCLCGVFVVGSSGQPKAFQEYCLMIYRWRWWRIRFCSLLRHPLVHKATVEGQAYRWCICGTVEPKNV